MQLPCSNIEVLATNGIQKRVSAELSSKFVIYGLFVKLPIRLVTIVVLLLGMNTWKFHLKDIRQENAVISCAKALSHVLKYHSKVVVTVELSNLFSEPKVIWDNRKLYSWIKSITASGNNYYKYSESSNDTSDPTHIPGFINPWISDGTLYSKNFFS